MTAVPGLELMETRKEEIFLKIYLCTCVMTFCIVMFIYKRTQGEVMNVYDMSWHLSECD